MGWGPGLNAEKKIEHQHFLAMIDDIPLNGARYLILATKDNQNTTLTRAWWATLYGSSAVTTASLQLHKTPQPS